MAEPVRLTGSAADGPGAATTGSEGVAGRRWPQRALWPQRAVAPKAALLSSASSLATVSRDSLCRRPTFSS